MWRVYYPDDFSTHGPLNMSIRVPRVRQDTRFGLVWIRLGAPRKSYRPIMRQLQIKARISADILQVLIEDSPNLSIGEVIKQLMKGRQLYQPTMSSVHENDGYDDENGFISIAQRDLEQIIYADSLFFVERFKDFAREGNKEYSYVLHSPIYRSLLKFCRSFIEDLSDDDGSDDDYSDSDSDRDEFSYRKRRRQKGKRRASTKSATEFSEYIIQRDMDSIRKMIEEHRTNTPESDVRGSRRKKNGSNNGHNSTTPPTRSFRWSGKHTRVQDGRKYYDAVIMDKKVPAGFKLPSANRCCTIHVGDFVGLLPETFEEGDCYWIARVQSLFQMDGEMQMLVRWFFRPNDIDDYRHYDPNDVIDVYELFLDSTEECLIEQPVASIREKLHVLFLTHCDAFEPFRHRGDTMYCRLMYDSDKKSVYPLPTATYHSTIDYIRRYPELAQKELEVQIPCLELFAGCGGLALGFQQAGITPKWLVEIDASAVQTLKQHFKSSHVIHEDANALLTIMKLYRYVCCCAMLSSPFIERASPTCLRHCVQRGEKAFKATAPPAAC